MRVAEIMQTDLVTSAPDAAVVDVARLLTKRRVGACLIMEHGELVGIFTERDLVRLVASGDDVRREPVSTAMTTDVTVAPPDADLVWAGETMRRLGVRHLPVGEGTYVAGIVSIRDLYAAAEAVLRLDPRGAETARGVLAAAGR
ncbi:MAG TPA: CBS domain-containing protein [Gaiellales bacterium]|jgi:CBS domain-containing protein|nr:CBS domain-containing protein [Gaiellales bacterium]